MENEMLNKLMGEEVVTDEEVKNGGNDCSPEEVEVVSGEVEEPILTNVDACCSPEEVVADDMSDEILYDAESGDEAIEKTIDPDAEPKNPDEDEEQMMEKYCKNVCDTGVLDTNFIKNVACPVCGFKIKKASKLFATKNFKAHDVGIATICQNCGHFDIYGTDINNLLFYLQGKGNKCKFKKVEVNVEPSVETPQEEKTEENGEKQE